MSKHLSELLGATEPMFTIALKQLEQASGNFSVDVRLTAEIIGKVHLKTRELGLDPKDTTGKELYQALLNLVEKHDEFLVKRIGGTNPRDVQDLIPRMKKAIEELDVPKKAWVIKHSVAKQLLKNMPPRTVMRHLGYRSVDSMLKRENLAEIYGSLRFAESPEWLNKFIQTYKKLKPSDFETREIEFVQLGSERWGKLTAAFTHKKLHNITHLKELGVILLLPMPMVELRGLTIFAFPLLIHYINEIRLYSTFFKFKQVKSNFSEILIDTLIADPGNHTIMAGQQVHWRVIQRYFARLENEYHPEIFEPHVQPEDLHWRKAEEVLFKMEPALHFWYDMDYVAVMHAGRPLPISLLDIAADFINDKPYEQRAIYHFRDSLWNEIFVRYMGQKTLENQILRQLDNEMIAPESIATSLRFQK
ncbi:hypothetical protein HY003_02170 [Candidatus Saccharibacteria bacterium]|nr:hypothetical protein [Candidatus Saccharibacteria bacterium]MBI3338082.1 hypothetical protein [Candidatus Saccharibacteria bacterium]